MDCAKFASFIVLLLCVPDYFTNGQTTTKVRDRFLINNVKICGFQHSDDRFHNETSSGALIDEYPWVALLKYVDEITKTASFRCIGSLISSKYVLTSARCIIISRFTSSKLTEVRLGEQNLRNEKDCINNPSAEECSDPVLDVKIEETIPHPYFQGYNMTINVADIGLLRLEEEVELTDFVRPICLPFSEDHFATPGQILYTSGWGESLYKYPDTLLETKKKVENSLVSDEACQEMYRKVFLVEDKVITDNFICAIESHGNPCLGDTGGPLMFPFSRRNQWHQEGIIMCGPKFTCDNGTAWVYLKVSQYIDWIEETIRP